MKRKIIGKVVIGALIVSMVMGAILPMSVDAKQIQVLSDQEGMIKSSDPGKDKLDAETEADIEESVEGDLPAGPSSEDGVKVSLESKTDGSDDEPVADEDPDEIKGAEEPGKGADDIKEGEPGEDSQGGISFRFEDETGEKEPGESDGAPEEDENPVNDEAVEDEMTGEANVNEKFTVPATDSVEADGDGVVPATEIIDRVARIGHAYVVCGDDRYETFCIDDGTRADEELELTYRGRYEEDENVMKILNAYFLTAETDLGHATYFEVQAMIWSALAGFSTKEDYMNLIETMSGDHREMDQIGRMTTDAVVAPALVPVYLWEGDAGERYLTFESEPEGNEDYLKIRIFHNQMPDCSADIRLVDGDDVIRPARNDDWGVYYFDITEMGDEPYEVWIGSKRISMMYFENSELMECADARAYGDNPVAPELQDVYGDPVRIGHLLKKEVWERGYYVIASWDLYLYSNDGETCLWTGKTFDPAILLDGMSEECIEAGKRGWAKSPGKSEAVWRFPEEDVMLVVHYNGFVYNDGIMPCREGTYIFNKVLERYEDCCGTIAPEVRLYAIGDGGGNPGEGPDDPGDTPDDPGDTPSDPGDTPDDPGDTPSEPGDTPSDPGDTPDDPGDTPSDPGDTPSDPGDMPSDPGDTPSDPGNKPSDPENKPDDPGEKPSDPGNKPDNPGDNPGDKPGKDPKSEVPEQPIPEENDPIKPVVDPVWPVFPILKPIEPVIPAVEPVTPVVPVKPAINPDKPVVPVVWPKPEEKPVTKPVVDDKPVVIPVFKEEKLDQVIPKTVEKKEPEKVEMPEIHNDADPELADEKEVKDDHQNRIKEKVPVIIKSIIGTLAVAGIGAGIALTGAGNYLWMMILWVLFKRKRIRFHGVLTDEPNRFIRIIVNDGACEELCQDLIDESGMLAEYIEAVEGCGCVTELPAGTRMRISYAEESETIADSEAGRDEELSVDTFDGENPVDRIKVVSSDLPADEVVLFDELDRLEGAGQVKVEIYHHRAGFEIELVFER